MRKVREFRPLYRWTGAAAAIALGVVLPGAVAHAQAGFAAGLKLAPNIERAADLAPPKSQYVVTNGASLYKSPANLTSAETGIELKVGEKPQALAEALGGLWLLVGKGGTGIGYVSRGLVCPTTVCK